MSKLAHVMETAEHRLPVIVPYALADYWRAILRCAKHGHAFTASDIASACGEASAAAVSHYLEWLRRAGHVTEVPAAPGAARVFRAANTPAQPPAVLAAKQAASKTEAAFDRIWRIVHIGGSFTAGEMIARLPDLPRTLVHGYLDDLCAAGFLKYIDGTGLSKCWKFLGAMNTGPLAPLPCTVRFVFDRNTQSPQGRAALARVLS